MKLTSYLYFDGQCEAAFKFYETRLDGKLEGTFPYEGSPIATDVPSDFRKKQMHATLVIGDQTLMGADVPPGRYQKPTGFAVSIGLKDVTKAERIFKSLSEGAKITMPIQETFWAARFGMLTDQFGIPWMINCEKAM